MVSQELTDEELLQLEQERMHKGQTRQKEAAREKTGEKNLFSRSFYRPQRGP